MLSPKHDVEHDVDYEDEVEDHETALNIRAYEKKRMDTTSLRTEAAKKIKYAYTPSNYPDCSTWDFDQARPIS